MDICIQHKLHPLTLDFLVRGVAQTEKTLCDAVDVPYREIDAIQNALAATIATNLILDYTGSQEKTLDDLPLIIDGATIATQTQKTFAEYGFGSDALSSARFPFAQLFAPQPERIRSMGMTDGGRVRVRYTVKKPKEAVRPGNIPNETRMTMANYENELGVVPLRGRVRNPDHVHTANEIIFDPDLNAMPESVPIGQLDDWLVMRHTCSKLKKFDAFTTYLDNIHNVDIYDSLLPGWTRLRKWMKCSDPNLSWFRIKTSTGVNRLFTFDHPLPIEINGNLVRIQAEEIAPGMVMFGCKTDRTTGNRRAIPIEVVENKSVSHELIPPSGYDVETDSDRFDIDTIVTHNCRTTSIA
ncbi:MAG: hypothetical protein IJS54_01735 [Desulfovibrio sp.]|nr:hypothetical protein [Desulfovibrio sp.]